MDEQECRQRREHRQEDKGENGVRLGVRRSEIPVKRQGRDGQRLEDRQEVVFALEPWDLPRNQE